jgi:5-oxoprolinase (ATP-hydrolysing)
MKNIIIHRFAGILSAYGIGLADIVNEEQEPSFKAYDEKDDYFNTRVEFLKDKVVKKLKESGFDDDRIETISYLNMRYKGTDFTIMTSNDNNKDYRSNFEDSYFRQYGFTIKGRDIIVDDIRVRGIGKNEIFKKFNLNISQNEIKPISETKVYFEKQKWLDVPVYNLNDCYKGLKLNGPGIIMQNGSTILLTPNCFAEFSSEGNVLITLTNIPEKNNSTELNNVRLSIFSHRFMSIAEQMGNTLKRTAISTNIKERLDFSCALFGPDGSLVSNGLNFLLIIK